MVKEERPITKDSGDFPNKDSLTPLVAPEHSGSQGAGSYTRLCLYTLGFKVRKAASKLCCLQRLDSLLEEIL